HTHHKLLYILSGKLILEGPEDRWLVLPSHIAFIPATREHWITFPESTRLITIYLNPEWTPWTKHGCWVTTVNPLAREMALFGLRWNQYRDPGDGLANQFFRTLGSLCAEWFAKDPLLWLPKGRTPELQRAMDYASAHLENANINDAAKNANISVRTLRRYFLSEVGMSWRDYLINARMVRAMELLLHEGQSVTNTALEVGFSSLGAFTCAFSKFAGQTPSAFAKTHTGARTAL
ncbi:MAG: AraC family transcriptional regulator, partial [Deltaproteobacteria bacterium]|nr:AraC family transcriptional regulator [Deltaproteobacteria bacterium]